jgi:CRP/FNR family transcriptional regulator
MLGSRAHHQADTAIDILLICAVCRGVNAGRCRYKLLQTISFSYTGGIAALRSGCQLLALIMRDFAMYAVTTIRKCDHVQARQAVGDATPDTIGALFGRQSLNVLDAGASLIREGDESRYLYEVVEGVLRVVKIIGDGRRVITGFLYPGEFVGVSLKDRYLYSVEAVTHTSFRRFRRRDFQDAINASATLRPELFSLICDEMAAAQKQMVLLSRKNAEERLCSFLLARLHHEQQDCPDTSVVDLPMTRLDIADYLGMTIETVSRTITKLTGRGIIAPAGRHSLRILKIRSLSNLAGDDSDCRSAGTRHN